VFNLGQHVPENADRKRRHYERDDQKEKDEGSYILNDSLKKLKITERKNDGSKNKENAKTRNR